MRHKISSTIIALLVVTMCTAKQLLVGINCEFASINAAINFASPGDTISVQKGLYREGNININKSITLFGIEYPVIDGENLHENITVTASNVRISGFMLVNSGRKTTIDVAAIKVLSASNVFISENQIHNCNFGIYLSDSDSCVAMCNDIIGSPIGEQNSGNGIHLWKCAHAVVQENYITGHRDGIYFEFVTESGIYSNSSEYNIRYGLHFMFSHNDDYWYNLFHSNGSGVAVMYSRKVNMYKNYFDHNWGDAAYGILLKDISDSHIWQNHFEYNSAAIYLEGASRINIEENTFRSNGWALRVQASCDANTIRSNNFFGNSFDVATNGSLVLNTFNENYWDKYEGYDLNTDGIGDIPFRPVSLYAVVVEQMPYGLMLMRSFMVYLLDRSEKIIPSLTPENLTDDRPLMKPVEYIFLNQQ